MPRLAVIPLGSLLLPLASVGCTLETMGALAGPAQADSGGSQDASAEAPIPADAAAEVGVEGSKDAVQDLPVADVESGADAAVPDDAPADAVNEPAAEAGPGPMAVLDGVRWELPCMGAPSGDGCPAAQMTKTIAIAGTPPAQYEVVVRFRGVVEQSAYEGGTAEGMFYRGGVPAPPVGWNVYSLAVSDPAGQYYMNAGTIGVLHCYSVDYQVTIAVAAGAQVVLSADAVDGQQVYNHDADGQPIVVSGVAPAPAAYDGQFLQMDVISVKAM